jgi:type I restriction enzyme S subunit
LRLPSVREQKRIAAILDKADAIRRKRQQALELADEFLRSLFLDMFGDPISNAKGWPVQTLSDCAVIEGGGTPAKKEAEYWRGSIPWISPKDMKRLEISGSADHISEGALAETRLQLIPKESTLVVVRGMILARDVPIALTRVPCTINQDMKALLPQKELDSIYFFCLLQSMQKRLLSKVSTSTHGTRKLDTEHLQNLSIPVPPKALQQRFRMAYEGCRAYTTKAGAYKDENQDLVVSTAARAFQGHI